VFIAGTLLFLDPAKNPDYYGVLHRISAWLIEIGVDGLPKREIGLDASETPILGGPSRRNQGFWRTTDFVYDDFTDSSHVGKDEFERAWSALWKGARGDSPK
jgi:hypothetical protein